jgi:hypothetical protein
MRIQRYVQSIIRLPRRSGSRRGVCQPWHRYVPAMVLVLLVAGLSPANRIPRAASEEITAAPVQELRKRRDIRAVEKSPQDLKNLRHAFFMLKKQKPTCNDANAKSEYDCWAAYHNNFDQFGCRHLIDLFWPWHRYHLVEFEKALRSSDQANPDRVQNVTLPYWNWTETPSGKDFPASLEQQMLKPGEFYAEDCPDSANCINPLWIGGRRQDKTCQSVKAQCVREAVDLSTWRAFGGGETAGQVSDFELQAHNFMHSRYIAGPMGDPRTAAQDPIYWLFHSYIDKIWDEWQKQHQSNPCLPANVPNPARRLTLGDWPASDVAFQNVLCTKGLDYEYVPFEPPVVAALPSCPARGAICVTSTDETPIVLTMGAVPENIEKAELRLTGVTVPERFSYDAWVLFHPSAARYRPKDRRFLDQYVATSFVAWKAGEHVMHAGAGQATHASTMDVQLDVTSGLKRLVTQGSAKGIASTIVFSPSSKAERSKALVFGSDVTFVSASLLITSVGVVTEIPLRRK